MDLYGFTKNGLSGYDIYVHIASSTASMFYIGIFTGIFIGGAFSKRTYGMALFNGCPASMVFFSKFIVYIIGVLIIWLVNSWTGAAVVSAQFGFMPHQNNEAAWGILYNLTASSIASCVIIGCFYSFLAVCIKNVAGIIGAGYISYIIADQTMFSNQNANKIYDRFLYDIPVTVAVTLIACVVLLIASAIVFQKSEFK